MTILKRILNYLIWSILSFLSAFGYMRIILGPKPEPSTGWMKIFDSVYDIAMLNVGVILGSIIALLYILIDVFYLKQKLKNNTLNLFIRFLTLIAIISIVSITHYIIEKVIDII